MALLKLMNDITDELDKEHFVLRIFIDLAKTFETVNHKLLLRKMKHYGIRGNALLTALVTYPNELSMYYLIISTLKLYL